MRLTYGMNDITQAEVTNYVSSIVKRAEFNEGYILGNVTSYELEITFNNLTDSGYPVINFVADGYFVLLDDNNNQQGIFYVYEKPEKYTSSIKITAYDSVIKTHIPYKTSLDYDGGNITVKKQLDEMATLTGVEINYSNIPSHISSKIIKWYDTTILIADYLGWIAELSGMNVECNATGIIIFKPLNTEPDFIVDSLGDLSTLDNFQVSKVCFNNGLLVFEQGDDTYNTLYVNPNNAYVDDPSLITPLYTRYNGYKFLSVDNVKMMGSRDIRLGDRIRYGDKEFLVLSMTATEYGGEAEPIFEIGGKMNPKNDEIAVNRIDPETKIRRLQVLYDQNDTTINLMAQDLEKTATNINSLSSRLNIAEDSINSIVINQVTEADVNEIYESKISQTSEEISLEIKSQVGELSDSTDSRLKEFETWFKFSSSGLEIGKSDSKFKANLDNEKLAFKEDNEEVAYVSNRRFLVTEMEILVKLFLGNFAFIPRANGSLDFRKVK